MKKFKLSYFWVSLLFILYISFCFYLMFFQREPQGYYDYNLVPFKIIMVFYHILTTYPKSYLIYALNNLFGNIILFIPLGYFLPRLFEGQRKLFRFLATVIISISIIEFVQFITMYGTGDVDDVILNTTGAIIGFCLYKFIQNAKKENIKN